MSNIESNEQEEQKEEKQKEEEREVEYVVQQDDHSFSVLESDIQRFPNSFLAALINAEKNGFKKSVGVILVQDRNTDFFEYVQQVYKKGNVKIKDENVLKSEVTKELEFWFTDYQIPVRYKDRMFNLVTMRHEYFYEHFTQRRDAYKQILENRASMGFLDGVICEKADINFPNDENQREQCCAAYARFFSELYPKDEFSLTMTFRSFSATWKLHVSALGKMTERALDEKCKKLWKRLFVEAEKSSFNGICTILIKEEEEVAFFRAMEDIFKELFANYVKQKSKYNVDLKWSWGYSKFNLELSLTWGFPSTLNTK